MSVAWPRTDPGPRQTLADAWSTRSALVAAVATVLAGAPVGLIWAATTHRVPVVVVAGGAQLAHPEGEAAIASDAHYLIATAIAGVVCGAVALLLASRRGLPVMVGLTVGSLAAAVVAWRAGHLLDYGSFRAALHTAMAGRHLLVPVDLGAKVEFVVWPFCALVTYLIGFAVRAVSADEELA